MNNERFFVEPERATLILDRTLDDEDAGLRVEGWFAEGEKYKYACAIADMLNSHVARNHLPPVGDTLDDEHPLWCVNEQIKGLLEGHGASEDHEDVLNFLRSTGLPEGTVSRMHRALVNGDVRGTDFESISERKRVVVCAAVKFVNNSVVCSARHYDERMRETLRRLGVGQRSEVEQGFVDQWGSFMSRREAWGVAAAAGQILRRVGGDTADGGTLYSENLY